MPYENESNLQRSLDTIVYISDIKLTQIFKKFCSDFKLIQLTYFNSIMFYDDSASIQIGFLIIVL